MTLEAKGILKKLVNFVGKDTKSQNESKKLIVVIRILLLSIAFYCLFGGILYGAMHGFGKVFLFTLFLIACIIEFIMSYRCRTMLTLWILISVQWRGSGSWFIYSDGISEYSIF